MPSSFTLDIGTGLQNLGFTFLIFKYVLPYLVGFALIMVALVLGFGIYQRLKGENMTREQILLSLVAAGLIAILFIV